MNDNVPLAVWLSAITTQTATYPFRNVAWRSQIELILYKKMSFIDLIKTPRHLYRGVMTNYLVSPLYPLFYKISNKFEHSDNSFAKKLFIGMSIGYLGAFWVTPLEVAGIFTKLHPPSGLERTNLLEATRKIIERHGVLRLWKGTNVLGMKCSTYFAGLTVIQPYIDGEIKPFGKENPLANQIAGSAISALFACIVSHPTDVITTITQSDLHRYRSSNAWTATKYVFRQYGLSGFTKGFVPRYIGLTIDLFMMRECTLYYNKFLSNTDKK
jgi:hypothetical protein